MRPDGETGVRAHLRALAAFLEGESRAGRLPAGYAFASPFDAPAPLALPFLGVRRLLEPLSGTAAVGWYRWAYPLLLRRALARRLRDGAPAVVLAQCPPSAAAALAARTDPSQRVALTVHFNGSQADEWAGMKRIARDGALFRAIHAFEAEVLPQVDALVFVSEFMRAELARRVPAIAGVPYAVIPNFVDDPWARTAPDDPRRHARTQPGGAEPAAVHAPAPAYTPADLIAIGSLEPRKNVAYVLEVLAHAHALGAPLTLTVVGDGPERAVLRRLATALGVAHAVRFAGYVPDARRLIAGHRALVHAARAENLPLALVEALAEGVPVFAVPVGGVPEVFDDGVEGVRLPADDARAAAARVVAALADGAALQRMGEAARTRFLARFHSPVAAARLLGFLEGL